MKNQRDSVDYSKTQSTKEADLKDEIQEMSSKLETGLREAKHYKQKSFEREKELSSVSRRSGASFFEQQVGLGSNE
jgi:hypothetical protein